MFMERLCLHSWLFSTLFAYGEIVSPFVIILYTLCLWGDRVSIHDYSLHSLLMSRMTQTIMHSTNFQGLQVRSSTHLQGPLLAPTHHDVSGPPVGFLLSSDFFYLWFSSILGSLLYPPLGFLYPLLGFLYPPFEFYILASVLPSDFYIILPSDHFPFQHCCGLALPLLHRLHWSFNLRILPYTLGVLPYTLGVLPYTLGVLPYNLGVLPYTLGAHYFINLRITFLQSLQSLHLFNLYICVSLSIPHSSLNKLHIALAYHPILETIASGAIWFFHCNGVVNPAEVLLTKFLVFRSLSLNHAFLERGTGCQYLSSLVCRRGVSP